VKVAQQLDPLVVLMENVPGIQNAQEGEALASILRAFGRAGFAVSYRLLKATSFGIPQTRSRVFFIGVNRNRVKGAEKVLLRILRGIESASRSAGRLTVRQALSGLPRIMPGSGGFVITKRAPGRPTKYSRTMSKGSRLIFNHETRMHNPRDLAIFRELRWGETARKFEARNPGRVPYNLDSFGDKYRKLHPGKPSPTIPSHLKRDANSFVHPFVSRGITPREAARLQSFPDEYIFLGGMGPSFVQIGNAVPPLLAEVLGREIAKAVF
jgi:DNA (cytosine-5)-methyltransferase 1